MLCFEYTTDYDEFATRINAVALPETGLLSRCPKEWWWNLSQTLHSLNGKTLKRAKVIRSTHGGFFLRVSKLQLQNSHFLLFPSLYNSEATLKFAWAKILNTQIPNSSLFKTLSFKYSLVLLYTYLGRELVSRSPNLQARAVIERFLEIESQWQARVPSAFHFFTSTREIHRLELSRFEFVKLSVWRSEQGRVRDMRKREGAKVRLQRPLLCTKSRVGAPPSRVAHQRCHFLDN